MVGVHDDRPGTQHYPFPLGLFFPERGDFIFPEREDYIAFVGNVAYNAAQGSGACYSGLNIYEPIASDTNTGTHMFVAGNFAYANVDGDPCAGSAP